MMRFLVPFAFYGYGNTGDEATLNGFAQLLAHAGVDARVSICSRNPAHTARVEPRFKYFGVSRRDPRRWFAGMGASAHIFAGGTPIQDVLGEWPLSEVVPLVRAADQARTPVTFVGVGVEGLRSDRSRRILAEEIIPRVQHWSVRSARDQDRLLSWGASADAVTVAADMAWLIDPVSDSFGAATLAALGADRRQPLVAVNLVNENDIFDRQPEIVQGLAEGLDGLIRTLNARVIFIAQEVRDEPTFDTAAALRVRARMALGEGTVLVPTRYYSPRELMSIISCCDLSISMRYHFCLLNALQSKPFLAILRSDKLSDLCWDLAWDARMTPSEIDAETLLNHAQRLARNAAQLGSDLERKVGEMKTRALRSIAALNVLGGRPVVNHVDWIRQ
jgi:polysaccharide pyruvyl transferase WcaK-like protein